MRNTHCRTRNMARNTKNLKNYKKICAENNIQIQSGGLMKNLSKESLLENAYCGYKFIF